MSNPFALVVQIGLRGPVDCVRVADARDAQEEASDSERTS